ncbi:molybdate transport system regulatory protein [Candidatus Magnetomoraceae bacterium gMMP-15]
MHRKKHYESYEINENLRKELLKQITNNKLPCAIAFKIIKKLNISSEELGRAADLMKIRLIKCQLGLYGYKPKYKIVKPADTVSPDLEKAIKDGLVNNRLPCKKAWEIATDFRLRKMQVSNACEALKIRIKPCQLGAF